jgi:transcription initiation factor TFIIIB Brf1 subunit/transcription initiation factor TFIIB
VSRKIMARKELFRTFKIAKPICERLERKMAREARSGSLNAFMETVLDRFAQDLTIDVEVHNRIVQEVSGLRTALENPGEVKAVRVRKLRGEDEQQKSA